MRNTSQETGSRFELKYLISEETAIRVRDFVQTYLSFDAWSVGGPDYGYTVHTLYLDTDQLALFWHAIEDPEHRWQLRVRHYSEHTQAPVYCEIKHWNGDSVLKESYRLPKDAFPALIAGSFNEFLMTQPLGEQEAAGLSRFVELKNEVGARPKLHVAFSREGYQSEVGDVRVTLDRSIRFQPHPRMNLPVRIDNACSIPGDTVVLELKYTDRYPRWCSDMVETLDLLEGEFDKYLVCCSAAGAMNYGRLDGGPFPASSEQEDGW